MIKKGIALLLISLLVINIILLAFRVINSTVFWFIIILGFISAKLLYPRQGKRHGKK